MTNRKKKVIVCWNESKYVDEIKSKFNELKFNGLKFAMEPCCSFKPLEDSNMKADYMIVLCELKWSHGVDKGNYSDLNGIKLVQYLRSKKNIQMPVLFVSFLSMRDIVKNEKHKDKIIICTPALQHGFIRLPSTVNDWVRKLSEMKDMTELELLYTKELFCDIEGLVKDLNHSINGCYSLKALYEKFEVVKFVVDNKYRQFETDLLDIKLKLESLDENNNEAVVDIKKSFREIFNKIIY